MTVRDYQSLAPAVDLVDWEKPFDHARAVKSDFELASVRDSVRINTDGFWLFLEAFAPGRTSARSWRRPRSTSSSRAADARRWTWCSSARTAPRCPSSRSPAPRRVEADRHDAALARGRGPGRALGRGVPRDLPGRAERRVAPDDGGLRGVLRGGSRSAARRSDGPRRPPGRREGLPRPRLPPRPRHRALDRDDDDRVPEDRRGRRDGAEREHDLLDAPARDLRGRPGMPLHAGHLARHSRRRRSARRPPDADLRRDGDVERAEALGAGAAGRGRLGLRALPPHRRAARAPEDLGGVGPPRRAPLPDRPPVVGAVAEAGRDRGRRGDAPDRRRHASAARSGSSVAGSTA